MFVKLDPKSSAHDFKFLRIQAINIAIRYTPELCNQTHFLTTSLTSDAI